MAVPTNTVQQDGIGTVTADQYNTFLQSVAGLNGISGFGTGGLQNFVGVSGMVVYVPGLASVGDGNQGDFYWNASGTANDGINNIQPNGTSLGCWTRVPYIVSSITGNLAVSGTLGVTGATTLNSLAASGAATIGGGLGVTGAITATGNVTGAEFLGSGAGLTSVPGSQLVGTTTNDSAAAGDVGEYMSSYVASGSAVGLTTLTPAAVASISLTAGDWDVWGQVQFMGGTSTTVNFLQGGISSTSAGITSSWISSVIGSNGTLFNYDSDVDMPIISQRVSVAGTTIYYLNAQANFGTSTCSAYGGIYARRRR